MNLLQQLSEDRQALASLEAHIQRVELRRDYPPAGCLDSNLFHSTVQKDLRALYVGRARLLQIIQRLEGQREPGVSKTLSSVLERTCANGANPEITSGNPSFSLSLLWRLPRKPIYAASSHLQRCVPVTRTPS